MELTLCQNNKKLKKSSVNVRSIETVHMNLDQVNAKEELDIFCGGVTIKCPFDWN